MSCPWAVYSLWAVCAPYTRYELSVNCLWIICDPNAVCNRPLSSQWSLDVWELSMRVMRQLSGCWHWAVRDLASGGSLRAARHLSNCLWTICYLTQSCHVTWLLSVSRHHWIWLRWKTAKCRRTSNSFQFWPFSILIFRVIHLLLRKLTPLDENWWIRWR